MTGQRLSRAVRPRFGGVGRRQLVCNARVADHSRTKNLASRLADSLIDSQSPMNHPAQLLFTARAITADDGGVRVEVEGELDLATAPQLEEVLRRELAANGAVILDLSRVTFMDSSGLRAIITMIREADHRGQRLRVAGSMLPQLQRLIEITGLRDVLPVDSEGRPAGL
jgi:anti-sigma B factor antagonist